MAIRIGSSHEHQSVGFFMVRITYTIKLLNILISRREIA